MLLSKLLNSQDPQSPPAHPPTIQNTLRGTGAPDVPAHKLTYVVLHACNVYACNFLESTNTTVQWGLHNIIIIIFFLKRR